MITTPRGVAIPIPFDHAFCLLARLHPTVKPYTVLETAAGFYKMPGLVGLVAGVACFVIGLEESAIAGITVGATLAGYLMSVYATYPPGLLRLARIYSLATGYGIVLIAISVLGIITVGWKGTVAFWSARLLAELITMWHAKRMGGRCLELIQPEASRMAKASGLDLAPDGFAVRCFGNAYATYALKYGAPMDAHPSQGELASDRWRSVFQEFVNEWPQVARRFQLTEQDWREVLPRAD